MTYGELHPKSTVSTLFRVRIPAGEARVRADPQRIIAVEIERANNFTFGSDPFKT